MPGRTFPPGPRRPFIGPLIAPGRHPLALFERLSASYGDLVHLRMSGEHVFLLNRPEYVRDVLVTHARHFTKSRALERAKTLLGEGLLTSEGASHLRSRRVLQPHFHRDRVADHASIMVHHAERLRARWKDGEARDVADDMMRLTLAIVARALFDVDIDARASVVGEAVTNVLGSFWVTLLPFPRVIARLPVPALRRARAARARLDEIIYEMIAARRAAGAGGRDLLTMLLTARGEDGGDGFSDREVRDHAMTLLLAGHETTANALSWTWYLVSQAPDVQSRLHDEVDRVLGGRLPGHADVAALPFVERIVTESMRLYPPAWMVGRRSVAEYTIGGYAAPARSLFFMSQWLLHRDPRHYDEPERFAPDRWTPEMKAALPPFAYFPFGGGPRRCIGESFAWMELILLVATIAQQWELRLVPGHPVVPQPLITLRSRHGMRMTLRRRG